MANTKITTDALADGAITSAKLGSGAVNTQVASYLSSNSFVDTTALNSAVSTAVSNLVGSAPSTLDTLEELATSIGNSATLSSTLTSSIATKLPLAGGTLTGDLILGDSIKLELGAGTGGDLQLYHDGSHSYVTNTYASGALKLVSDDFRIENASNRNQLKTGVSGAVQLFFDDGSATGLRLGTTAAGVDVTGNIVVSGTVDGVDIAARDAVLTSTTTTAGAALPKAGGTMTGNLAINTGSPELYFGTTGNHYNWRIAAQELVDAGFEIAVGSQDTDYSNDTYVNKFVVKASGNVGIGTDTPDADLHISGSNDNNLIVQNSTYQNSGQNTEAAIRFKVTASADDERAKAGILLKNDGSAYGRGDLHFLVDSNDDNGNAVLADSKMVISHEGDVGIGTDTPASQLHMKHASGPTLLMTRTSTSTSGSIGEIVFGNGDWDSSMASIRAIQDGTNDGAKLEFKTQYNATAGEQTRLTIKRDGKVGIDEDTPLAKLHVVGGRTSGTTYNTIIAAGGVNSTDGSGARIILTGCENDPLARGTVIEGISTGTGNSHKLNFKTNNGSNVPTTRMTIGHTGNVGIGTTNPSAKLTVKNSANWGESAVLLADTDAEGPAFLSLQKYPATQATGGAVQMGNGDYIGGVIMKGFTNSGTNSKNYIEIWGRATNVAHGSESSMLNIGTYASGTEHAHTLVAREGKVGIGLTVPSNPLSVNGVITVGNFTAASISGTPGDANTAEVGPGYINLARDDTADAAQILFGKNGAVHSYLETRTSGLGFVTNVGDFAFEGGNVGIGTTSPDALLDIEHVGQINKDTVEGLLRLTGHSNTENSYGVPSAGVGVEFYNSWSNGTPYSMGRISARGEQSYNGGLQFDVSDNTGPGQDNFTTAMSIDPEGRVAIGTNNPAGRLHVDGATSAIPALTLESNSSGDVIPLHFKARANDGTFTYHGIWANPGTANTDNTINLGPGANNGIIVNNDGNVSIPSYQGITRSKSHRYHWTSPVTAIHTSQTRKTQVFRLYYCPNHWTSTPIDLDVELRSKYYENFSASFSIAQGYSQSEPELYLKHQAFNENNVRLVQGASTSAGYNYSGQPVYYTDFYIWCNTYMTAWVELTATTDFYSSNITSGWGGVTVNNSNGTNTTGAATPALIAPNVGMFSGHTFTAKEIQSSRGDAGTLITASSGSGNGSGITNFFSSLLSSSNNANCDHFKGTTQSVNSYKLLGNGSSTWSSDINLKRDVETTRDGYLADVNALRVVKYKWKNDPTSGVELGLIAQEVESIFPSLVTNDVNSVGDEIAQQDEVLYLPDDLDIPEGKSAGDIRTEAVAFQEGTTYKGVKYSVLPVITLKALQELSDKVDLLVSENAALKTRIETLEG